MNFKTTLDSQYVSIYGAAKKAGLSEKSNTSDEGVLIIEWHLHIEKRKWGIKSIDMFIGTVAGTVTVFEWNELDDKDHLIDIEGMEIVNECDFTESGMICIQDAEIDFGANKITLT